MSTNNRTRRHNIISSVDNSGTKLSSVSTDFDLAVNEFIRACNVKNLTGLTIQFYKDNLRLLVKYLSKMNVHRPVDVDKRHLEDIILEKKKSVKMVTVDKDLRGWKAFFNFLNEEGYLTSNPTAEIKPLKYEKKMLETFTKTQVKALLGTPNRATFTGYRDFVIMQLLLDTGIRISELEGVKITNIEWKNQILIVMGKGRKERAVPISSTLLRHLKEYVAIRGMLDHDFLFINIDNDPLRKRSIQDKISDYGKEAGIKGVRVSPHTFRHTFAKMYIMNGGDAFTLQKILGHTSLEIVKTYVAMFSYDIMKQHRKFSPLERLDED
ncbi:tyrosine-type recombinase/integrase [Paenibacillus sp. ACRRX]|uniref:tyrosine-type recombinase/integrase n=1 Tax=Paenibacillus sp. ACRRX TaxID=2918206 RepID=UPI001EF6BB14|nr:tyrosine-type recombinase/integrase [Paenibacillus sp. ACRRX]MCG7407758.1 tyrosine-type recombinase/integrase [Paenibacillus sp. ACRRX]